MNIQEAKRGTKVIVTEDSIVNGNNTSKDRLEVGETYTISDVSIGGWSTVINLDEFPGEEFNSVNFEDIGE